MRAHSLRFVINCHQLRQPGWSTTPALSFADLTRVESLPLHHRDPFDRLLAAQALERDLSIVSADRIFEEYGIERIW